MKTSKTNTASCNIDLIKLIRNAEEKNNTRLVDIYTSKLLLGNTGFVGQIVKQSGIRGGIEMEDLIQAGYVGMLEASRKFDLESTTQFTTFAHHWIQGAVTREGYRMGSIVQLSFGASERRVTISKLMNAYTAEFRKEMPLEMVSAKLNIPVKTIRAIIETFNSTVALDSNDSTDDEGSTLHDVIEDIEQDTFNSIELNGFITQCIIEEMDSLSAFIFQSEHGLNGHQQLSVRELFKQHPDKLTSTNNEGVVKAFSRSTIGLKSKNAREFFITRYQDLCKVETD